MNFRLPRKTQKGTKTRADSFRDFSCFLWPFSSNRDETPMILRFTALACLLVTGIPVDCRAAGSPTSIYVIAETDAPPIEQLAAKELAGQFERLFDDVRVVAAGVIPKNAQRFVLIGSPKTNAAVKAVIGEKWPKVSDQGIVIKSFKDGTRQGLVVGGGNPRATLWAVYELGHRHGIRYLFREDIYPLKKVPPKLSGFDLTIEPELRTRTWRTINDFAIGPESWGLEEHKRFLRQLAKMKFNDLMLSVYPGQPFVHYEFDGVKKQTARLFYGNRYRVDGDTVGKKAFSGAKFFENPDFAGKTNYEELTKAGIQHARGIIDEAHRLGMTVGISISPIEFPEEFQKVLPGSRLTHSLGRTMLPGDKQSPNDPKLKKLVKTKIRAYLKTYPTLDTLYLTLPEFPAWDQHAEGAWKKLSAMRNLTGQNLDQLVETARKRNLIASGKRGEQAIRGNVVMLAFLNELFADKSLLQRDDGSTVGLVIAQVDPALFPVLDRVVPKGAATLNFVDYTARRIVENRQLLAQVPASKVRSRLILTLADDNVGVLPQSTLQSIGELVDDLRKLGWDGFSTRYWVPAELDPTVHYLSRAAWDAKVTPRSAHDDLWVTTTGNKSAADRLWTGWQHLEQATNIIDKNNIGFTFPVKNMMMKHYRPAAVPAWWKEVNDHYTQSMIELYRAHGAIDPRSRKLLFYYAKRGEFPLEYLATVQAVREAALAKKAGDNEKAIEHLETAVESLYNAITTLSDIAQDQSDRGVIAVLNQHAYRPLLAEYERMLEAE